MSTNGKTETHSGPSMKKQSAYSCFTPSRFLNSQLAGLCFLSSFPLFCCLQEVQVPLGFVVSFRQSSFHVKL